MKWLVASLLIHSASWCALLLVPRTAVELVRTPEPAQSTETAETFSETNREQVRAAAEKLRGILNKLIAENGNAPIEKAAAIASRLDTESEPHDLASAYEQARMADMAIRMLEQTLGPAEDRTGALPERPGFSEIEDAVGQSTAPGQIPDEMRRRVEEQLRAMLADARRLARREARPPMRARMARTLSEKERAAQEARYATMRKQALERALDLVAWMCQHGDGGDNLGTGGSPGGERQPSIPLMANIPAYVEAPVIDPKKVTPAPAARRFTAEGKAAARWIFLDCWYLAGPFPNPNRSMIEADYPPEHEIDLDAVYLGDDGREVRWRFWQSSGPAVRMPGLEPYQIFYAWTELHFDKPADAWLALGGDDNMKVWINDFLVFQSSNQYKAIDIAEAYRKVHFQAGYNKVLVRLENSIGNGAFSFLVHNE